VAAVPSGPNWTQPPTIPIKEITVEKRFTCDATFERDFILCAEKIGNCSAGRKYTVSEA
jgi:hypothetical protein